MRYLWVTFLLIISFSASANEHLTDLLKNPAYLKSWNEMINSQVGVEKWLKEYATTFYGPNSLSNEVLLSDGNYKIASVCETHNCGPNSFYVLFSPKGDRAWGLLLKYRKNVTIYGKPDPEKEKAIREFIWK